VKKEYMGIKSWVNGLLKPVTGKITEFTGKVKGLIGELPQLWDKIIHLPGTVFATISGWVTNLGNNVVSEIGGFVTRNLRKATQKLLDVGEDVGRKAYNFAKDTSKQIYDTTTNALKLGVKSALEWTKNSLKATVKSAWSQTRISKWWSTNQNQVLVAGSAVAGIMIAVATYPTINQFAIMDQVRKNSQIPKKFKKFLPKGIRIPLLQGIPIGGSSKGTKPPLLESLRNRIRMPLLRIGGS
jgi:hypothetical protein